MSSDAFTSTAIAWLAVRAARSISTPARRALAESSSTGSSNQSPRRSGSLDAASFSHALRGPVLLVLVILRLYHDLRNRAEGQVYAGGPA
jgi:hypothetical protein